MERREAARVEEAYVEAEETPNSTFSNKVADINTLTEEVDRIEEVPSKETGADEVATRKEISELVKELKEANDKFSEAIRDCDDTSDKLNERVRAIDKDNEELKDRIMVKTMFYDSFRDEMGYKFGYDSGEEDEKNWQEILKKDKLKKKREEFL